MLISDDENLSTGLATSTKKPSNASLVKDYIGLMSAVDNPTPAGTASSFITLTNNKVYVEFGIISSRLRRRVLEAVARERHGDDGVRIVRLLLDVGKMDEKQVLQLRSLAST
jgi:DNA-directed RNA polymerase III subunit RPC3